MYSARSLSKSLLSDEDYGMLFSYRRAVLE